ncbi:hypothetical protein NBRC116188_13560 [Oceaniserpentilla sp. 4NH20-0058]|uniref:LuxR C-terminal-related transcriptional regulator n=1 Tax=Oceaniserpentilla sp. 4NH20-0058 TaxID=3127660 RepID=UPI003105F506
MNAAILTNKLAVPVAHDLIHRPTLCAQLQSKQDLPLIVLQAAAGFGKTSLICDWLQYSNQAVAWYSLDNGDNIPTTFWQYICEALSNIHPSITEEAKLFLTNQSIDDVLPICDSVISGLNQFTRHRLRPNQCVLVLDDFHLIHDERIIESISRFIDYKPYWLQLIITTRTLPELRIPNRISKQQAILITNHDLAFDKATCAEILNHQFDTPPSEDVLNYIFEQSKGWPAAVQLLIRVNDIGERNQGAPAVHQDLIADYLMEEVFLNLDDNTKNILNVICILPRFNLSTINMILDSPISKPEFEKFIHSGILISSTQNQSNEVLFKIHDLFREWLESNINTNNPDQAKTIRSNAIQHLIQIESLTDALVLAQKNEDWPLASNILGQILYSDYKNSHLDFTQFHLNQFPKEQFDVLPTLSVLKVNFAFQKKNIDEMHFYLEKGKKIFKEIEAIINNNLNFLDILSQYGFHSIEEYETTKSTLALLEDMSYLTDGQFTKLKTLKGEFTFTEQHPLYCWLNFIHFIHAFAQENFIEAIELGYRILELAKENKNINCVVITTSTLSQALYFNGHVKTAKKKLEETINWLTQINALNTPNIPWLYSSLGYIHIENLDFSKAYEIYDLVERNISEFTDPRGTLFNQYHFKLRLLVSTHQYEEADKWLKVIYDYEEKNLRNDLNKSNFQFSPDTILMDMLYQLKLGNTMPIIQWATNYEAAENNPPIKQSLESWLQAIGLMFCGQDKMDVFEELLQDAITNKYLARQVNLSLLIATLLFNRAQAEKASDLLISTLKVARDCGYKQIILDANPFVLSKLNELQSHEEVGNYCQYLLQANKEKSSLNFNTKAESADIQSPISINHQSTKQLEQLTRREEEILRLLAKSMRNQDIADQLGISLPTVKRHIQNIYSKLKINSRTEAALIYTQAQHS